MSHLLFFHAYDAAAELVRSIAVRLALGQMAPTFTTQDMYGRTVALSDFRGYYVLLSFYRFAVCPVCNIRMHELAEHAEAYKKRGLYFIACVESSSENMHYYLDRVRYPFPLIPALGGDLYNTYGVDSSLFGVVKGLLTRQRDYRAAARLNLGGWDTRRFDGKFGRMPADFLIGPDGRLLLAYYGQDHGDFLKLDDLGMLLRYQPPTPSDPRQNVQGRQVVSVDHPPTASNQRAMRTTQPPLR